MRRLTYEEIIELAKSDMKEAIREARGNMSLDRENGDWVGLVAELEEKGVA